MVLFYIFMGIIGCIELYFSKLLKSIDKKFSLFEDFEKFTNTNEVIKIRLKYSKILKIAGKFSIGASIFSTIVEPFAIKYEYLSMISIFLCMLVLITIMIIGILFIFVNIKNSKINKQYKLIVYIMIAVYFIGPYHDNIIFGAKNLYGLVFTSSIKKDKEFTLFKCKSDNHKKEKVYISINDIYKDKNNDLILDVNLRYDGKRTLNLYGKDGFSDLSGFYAEAVALNDRTNSKGFYIDIENELVTEYNPHIKDLKSKISSGEIINIKAPIPIKGSKLEDANIKDLKFKIDKSYSGNHYGVGIFKYVKVEK
ncbi:hypothetical protein [Faecalimicrobium sp. JNUCC 81]